MKIDDEIFQGLPDPISDETWVNGTQQYSSDNFDY